MHLENCVIVLPISYLYSWQKSGGCNLSLSCEYFYFLCKQVFLKDTDERACAYIAGPAPNRWGFTVDGKDLLKSISAISTADGELLRHI